MEVYGLPSSIADICKSTGKEKGEGGGGDNWIGQEPRNGDKSQNELDHNTCGGEG